MTDSLTNTEESEASPSEIKTQPSPPAKPPKSPPYLYTRHTEKRNLDSQLIEAYSRLTKLLRSKRSTLGISQIQLAKICKIKLEDLRKFEARKAYLTMDVLFLLASALHLNVFDLLKAVDDNSWEIKPSNCSMQNRKYIKRADVSKELADFILQQKDQHSLDNRGFYDLTQMRVQKLPRIAAGLAQLSFADFFFCAKGLSFTMSGLIEAAFETRSLSLLLHNLQSSDTETAETQTADTQTADDIRPARSFSELYPYLAMDWYTEKNGIPAPSDTMYHLNRKFWWRCHKCNYIWEASLSSRIKKSRDCKSCAAIRKKKDALPINCNLPVEQGIVNRREADLLPLDPPPGKTRTRKKKRLDTLTKKAELSEASQGQSKRRATIFGGGFYKPKPSTKPSTSPDS